jgi:urea transporter
MTGLFFFGATLLYPNIGLSGLLAALIALFTAKLFEFPHYKKGVHVFNSLLVGLSLGAFYEINLYLIGLIAIGAVLCVFLTVALIDAFWRRAQLPVLSLPFILVAGIAALVAQHYTSLSNFYIYSEFHIDWLPAALNTFFSTLGAIFFTTHPAAGLILFLGIALHSRYLAILAITGYVVGSTLFAFLTESPHPSLLAWTGFNFMLTAMALGGIYTIPSVVSFVTAQLGVALSVFLIIAIQNLLFVYGLPVLALPFVITTLVLLAAFRTRTTLAQPWLAPTPALPEINYERARLARVRNGEINSVPLLIPFYGQWNIYQGFDGPHTHKAPWQHALDFYITEDEVSYTNDGTQLEDFHCFALPVLSPAHGQVIRLYDNLPDNPPGEVNVSNNWGNFILIRLESGLHVLLAHLKENSIKVKEGDYVTPGTVVAACGNSGRSPQPHLHLQVQRTAELGSPTHPFHLSSLMHHKSDGTSEYRVVSRPNVGDRIEAAAVDKQLAAQLHLPVGRQLTYEVEGFGIKGKLARELQVELTLLGQFRLASDTGASAAFQEANGVLAFYDRQGPDDILLDMWILANGLTPLTESAHHWSDSPPAHLLPLNLQQKMLLWLVRPLGCGLDSRYQRHWDNIHHIWKQQGQHKLSLGTTIWRVDTESDIDLDMGCRQIVMIFNTHSWHAKLVEAGLASDQGIPGWNRTSFGAPKETEPNVNIAR